MPKLKSGLRARLAAHAGPAFVLDARGLIEAANRPAARYLKTTVARLAGKVLFDLLPPSLARPRQKAFRQVQRTGMPARVKDSHRDRYYDTALLPVLDAQARAMRVLVLTTDTTEETRKALESEQLAREWQQTFDSITDIVALISPDYRLIRVNKAGLEASGKLLSDLLGRKCFRTIHGTARPIRGCPCTRALKTRRPCSGEVSAGGRHYIATADPVLDSKGRLVAFTHTVKDITDRKLAEDELARHRKHLAELVEERTRELKQAQDELVRQGKLATLGRVAGGLASELRIPMGAVRRDAEDLGRVLTPAVGVQAGRLLASIQREAERTDRMAAAILDFVRQTRSRATRTSLRRILDRAMTHTGLPAGVSVHLALPPRLPPLTVDEQRMVTVFDHLLANAAQAMPDGGTIGVFASAQGKAVTIAVGDTGTGIKPEDMKHLFEPLFSTKALGAGIGLAMCKAFVEADGGRISVKSAPGRGTTVTVTLPTA